MKNLLTGILLCLSLSVLSANAALISRLGGQAVYDTDFNITWLADANLAASNAFGVPSMSSYGISPYGFMNWGAAQNWIGAMNAAKYLGFNNWRLPSPDTCVGFNCSGSEMGHLFYNELGGVMNQNISTIHNDAFALFQNLQSLGYFWSGGMEDGTLSAEYFSFLNGFQNQSLKFNSEYAMVVRPGDVASAPVPVPAPPTAWLLGSGLIGLFGLAKKRTFS